MKTGTFSKSDFDYVRTHKDMAPEHLAADLDRSVNAVKKALKDILAESPANLPSPRKKSKQLEMMTGKNDSGKSKGVIVATQASTALAEENRKSTPNNKFFDNIFVPYSKD